MCNGSRCLCSRPRIQVEAVQVMACEQTLSAASVDVCDEQQKDLKRIDVMFLCDEWKSSKGGLSTFNREFAVNLAKTTSDSINVHCYVAQSDEQSREDARQHGVNLITARRIPGSSVDSDLLDWLKIPPPELPNPDIVIGHGRKFGTPAYSIVQTAKCKWMHFVHVFCEDLGRFKATQSVAVDTIEENEKKHKSEIELCKAADKVVTVGSRLQKKYSRSLPSIKVERITPGILQKFSNESSQLVKDRSVVKNFNVFMFGRASFEDLTLKGYDIVANAIGSLDKTFELTFVGSSPGEHRKIERWFLGNTCISRNQLTIRGYCSEQDELKMMFHESDMIALPSRTEGFGLVALEAISAGIPVLVAGESGIAEALHEVHGGQSFIVESDDAEVWAQRIKQVSSQSLEERETSAKLLRESYNKTYPWSKECERFKRMIQDLVENLNALDVRIDVETMKPAEHNTQAFRTPASTVESEESQNGGHQMASVLPVPSGYTQPVNEVSQPSVEKVLTVIADMYLKATPLRSKDDLDSFLAYMREMRLIITGVRIGSLLITVKCDSLQILERLWEDYSCGHLGEVVQRFFVTEEILTELSLAELKLKTAISEEEYKRCKMFLGKDLPKDQCGNVAVPVEQPIHVHFTDKENVSRWDEDDLQTETVMGKLKTGTGEGSSVSDDKDQFGTEGTLLFVESPTHLRRITAKILEGKERKGRGDSDQFGTEGTPLFVESPTALRQITAKRLIGKERKGRGDSDQFGTKGRPLFVPSPSRPRRQIIGILEGKERKGRGDSDTQAEHTTKQEMQRVASERFLEAEAGKEATIIPIEEQPHNTLNLIHDHVIPSEDSCRKAVNCPTLKSPEHLWQDYRSDAAGNGQRVHVPNSISPDLSSQKGIVHDDEGVIIRDPLEVHCDKHGGEYPREHRWNKSHSSERVTPVGNLSQSGKCQDHGRTSHEEMAITAETLLANCQKDLQEKMTAALEQHAKKIHEVTRLLGRLRVSKHIRLEDFERIRSEREALKQKKEELQLQEDEFQGFKTRITSCLLDQSCQPLSRVKGTIKELRTVCGRECQRLEAALPMYARKTTIIDTVKENQVCVVLGETGSGKSTQMTQYLYEAGFAKNGLIVCTQPRKVAATSLAGHVAEEMGGVVGQVVGCHVGGNVQASETNSVLYATDHVLLNECLRDPKLSKYSCIIIDEAHERGLYSDLLLGMIKKSLAQRPELRVVITSATIDPALFVAYFDQCPVLKVSGRMFPVNVIWKDGPMSNAGNYLQEAVNTVQEIHQKEGPGDILVFLTSPVETERACENLGKIELDPNLVCFPLHGKLHQEDQRRVFEEVASKRKVIFATNCAETSITIAGIRYVVDTGMVKEMTFDPKCNKRSLEVTTINKSSAEQRKGRAGRTQAGSCYRLYSEEEYAAMEDRSKPEILRVHLGQAMLKLMELGIENVTEFEFVESPSLESIKLALKDLELLGATANRKLTKLGHRIARVPLEPRIAKLLFDGIDQGVGAEALALAAIATVSGTVFFRMGSEEEKHIADRKKVDFCHNGGDLLTLLEVYRQYLKRPKEHRNKWAFDNSLNAKSLRLADETIKELKLVLKHELNIILPSEFQHNDKTDLKLQKILVSCYAANLCVFTGHEKAGYRLVAFNHCAQLHPSSALKFLGETPQFIVFEQLLKTYRDFVINATPVEKTWLQEMMSEGTVNCDLEDLISTVLTEVALPCSRDLMTLAFGGFQRRLIDEVEEKVSKCCDGSLIVLEKNEVSGQVKIFVPPVHIVKALSVVGRHLEEYRKLLRDEQREEYLKEDCQSSRIVWGQGGEVQELLMPHMYRTVTVREIQDGNALVVLDYLKSFGNIVKHNFNEQNGKMRLFVTFKRSEDAAMAVKDSASNPMGIDEKVQPSQSMSDNAHAQVPQFKVKAKWSRRLGKGTGSIEFSTVEDSRSASSLSFQSLRIKSSLVAFRVDKYREGVLFMRGLHPETSVEDVKSVIEGRLPNVKVKNVFIHRIAGFDTSNETLESQKLSFQERLHTFATEGQFSIHLKRPLPKDFDGLAYLTFQDAEEAQAVVKGLSGERIVGIGIVTLQHIFSTFFLCSKNVFTLIEGELRTVAKELDMTFDKRLVMKVNSQRKGNRVSIEVESDCTEHFIRATTAFNVILNGDRIDCKTSKTLEILMTNQMKEVLKAIEKDTGTVINQDWKNRVVRIHGSETSRESAKRAINKFLDDSMASNSHQWEIPLRGPGKPRGLLKALFKRFGVDLKELQDIPGVQKMNAEFRNHVLKIQSSDEARETINRYVEEISKHLPKELSLLPSEYQTQVACGICLCDVDDATDLYRLACCGHIYDKSCIIQQLKSAEFPLKCATEDCEELLVLRDLQNLLSEEERKKLVISALDEYVKKNREIVKYCPTADCGMVYRVSKEGRRFTCCACLAEICTSCQVQWHNGLTCAMFKSGKQVEGRLEEWMMQDSSNRKNCPKCKTPIEKNEGCNHMTCSACKSHMCWLCMEVFTTGDQVYAHQKHCPKR